MKLNGNLKNYALFERFIIKFLGFKGISFSLVWIAFWFKLVSFDWPFVVFTLTLCGLKVGEDIGRQYLNNSH